MNVAEKRAEMEAQGEPWPECHDQPMLWKRDNRIPKGGWFTCRVDYLAWQNQHRKVRQESGLCVHCGSADLETTTSCAGCCARARIADRRYNESAPRRMSMAAYRRKKRLREKAAQGFQPTEVGQAAIAAAMAKAIPTGGVYGQVSREDDR
jgi:hypothetical protein